MTVHSNDLSLENVLERYPNVSVSDARATIASLIDDVRNTGQRHLITRHGTPLAVVIPMPDLLTLEVCDSAAREALQWPEGDVAKTEPLDLSPSPPAADTDEVLRKTAAAIHQDPTLTPLVSAFIDFASPASTVSGKADAAPEQAL